VVTADTYFAFIRRNNLEPAIRAELEGLDVQDSSSLETRSRRIRDLILGANIPPDVAAEIRASYEELGGGFVAVRSSATAEDLPEASFAGQQSTFLNVSGAENVVEAVQACWASLYEARAVFYREEAKFDHLSVGLAVPVQRMVQSEKSGVMFTAEPVSSDLSKITIEAVWGLGEGIVSGELNPDLYVVRKSDLSLETCEPVPQSRQFARSPGGSGAHAGANEWLPVSPELVDARKLTDSEVRELATIALAVEHHYGTPQDIEWAYEGGTFYLTQARPITTLTVVTAHTSEPVSVPETAPVLARGQAASPGVGVGKVRIVRSAAEIDIVQPGDVMVAEMTTPDFVPAMKRAAALVTERGGRTCHAAIVSRELGIPCVVGVPSATSVLEERRLVSVDGYDGAVFEGRAKQRLAFHEARQARYANATAAKTATRLYVNLAEPELADVVAKRNVDGVGLLRAEFIVAQIGKHPRAYIQEGKGDEYTQRLAAGIREFCAAFNPRPVVYRLTDFKTNEYANLVGGAQYEEVEENPMIGYRGASRYVREPDVFALEMEAIKRVRAEFTNLAVMVPFVRTPMELRGVIQLLTGHGLVTGGDFKLWMMVEVPSNVLILDRFIDEGIQGISIGSNDLTQLILGVDRDSEKLAETFDERNEAVLLAIETAVKTARARGLTVSICGQAPSVYPEVTERLVEWGATSVSVSPDMIDQTREIIAAAEAKLGILTPDE
jgi:pyruvate,water dikinase